MESTIRSLIEEQKVYDLCLIHKARLLVLNSSLTRLKYKECCSTMRQQLYITTVIKSLQTGWCFYTPCLSRGAHALKGQSEMIELGELNRNILLHALYSQPPPRFFHWCGVTF